MKPKLERWNDLFVELKAIEQMYDGVENCGVAFADLFAGDNFGKTVVRV